MRLLFPRHGKRRVQRHSLPARLLIPVLGILFHSSLFAQAGSAPFTLASGNQSLQLAATGTPATGKDDMNAPLVPAGVWQLPDTARYLLWVELEQGRLSVLHQSAAGILSLDRQVPISIGKRGFGKQREGDKLTPVGIYRLTSFLNDRQLDDYYGLGAYPLNYPNAHDAIRGYTGHGIWLHGLPKGVDQRPLLDSDGCVVIDNTSLLELDALIVPGQTYMVMTPGRIDWVPRAGQVEHRRDLRAALDAWKAAWEARDNAAYLDFYARDFTDLVRSRDEWAAYKTRVNNAKQFIDLEFSDLSMLAHPDQDGLVTVRYYQDYRSDNYVWSGWKEQLWRATPEGWRIVYEGNG